MQKLVLCVKSYSTALDCSVLLVSFVLITNDNKYMRQYMCVNLDDLQSQLCRHLLKTICTDIVNTVFSIYATEAMMSLPDTKDFTAEVHHLTDPLLC